MKFLSAWFRRRRRFETARMMAAAILSSHQMVLPKNKDKLADVCYEYTDALLARDERDD